MRTAALLGALLIASAACDSDDPDGDGAHFSAQVITNACAPNDAAAVRLTLADAVDPDTCTAPGASLVITVYSREIAAPATFQLAPADGDASLCPGGDAPCRQAERGSITFESYELDGAASGAFSIDFGTEVAVGSFAAERCVPDAPIRCG